MEPLTEQAAYKLHSSSSSTKFRLAPIENQNSDNSEPKNYDISVRNGHETFTVVNLSHIKQKLIGFNVIENDSVENGFEGIEKTDRKINKRESGHNKVGTDMADIIVKLLKTYQKTNNNNCLEIYFVQICFNN